MHIVYVCNELPPSQRAGGIGSYCLEISKGMTTKGHKVTVITASDDTRVKADSIENGVRVIRLAYGDFWVNSVEPGNAILKLRSLYRFFSYRKKIRKTIEQIPNIDIIEVGDYNAEGLFLLDIKIPVVVRLHTPALLDRSNESISKTTWKNKIVLDSERTVFKKAMYLSSCSRSLLDWVDGKLDSSPHLSTVIYNPVQFKSYSFNIGNTYLVKENTNIFYAGSIVDTKGVGDLVTACIQLIDNGMSNLHLFLAGKEGSYSSLLKNTISDNKQNNIHFLGKISREDLYNYYHFADVCCFPSWWENMPMVCLEAMMCEGLVIGSTSGGMKEIITDGVDGFLVQPKNPSLLKETLQKVLSLPKEEIGRIRLNARHNICNRFSLEKISEEMENFYLKVINDYKSKEI